MTKPLEDPDTEEAEMAVPEMSLLLDPNLLPPLLRNPALLRAELEMISGVGVDDGIWVLAGVAIRVGVMSLLVMMATVVRVLPRALMFGLALVLNKLGLMAGVRDRLGLLNVSLDLDDF
jgi:hypothetical protein